MEKIEMNRVIMIKYGELTTKKSNRKLFVNALYNNLKNKLKDYDVSFTSDLSRMYIEFNARDLENILDKINCVFGIHAYDVAYKVKTDISLIENMILEILKNLDLLYCSFSFLEFFSLQS